MSSPRAASGLGVDRAALPPGHEEGRLLVDERHEADGERRRQGGKAARDLQQRRDAAAVVVGARAAAHRIVVRAHDDDLAGSAGARPAHLEVRADDAARLIFLGADLIALGAPGRLDVVARRGQALGAEHVALADRAGQRLDMGAQAARELLGRCAHLPAASRR